jgi:hypothetical protein
MQKLLKYIILIGIFLLPLINSRITSLLWFSFSNPVSWNYEFTKVMFFNIWSSLVILLFFIQKFLSSFFKGSTEERGDGLEPLYTNYIAFPLFFFYIILLLSTIFSESPIISFLWNNEKSHSFLMWSNLVWLFIVFLSLLSLEKREYPKGVWVIMSFPSIIKTFIFSWVFVSIIGLKEYFFPTFDYWDLWNRLFSTFWHPNYLSIFLVSLMPFLYQKKWYINKSIMLLFLITLILTKSFIAIFLFFIFNLYYFWKKIKYKKILISLLVFFWFILIYNFLPEKLHSFVSRYFIWETTFEIIFSDIKIFLIWWWAETLKYFFNNFKSEYIYIFENLGYTADRPHNIILNFFYHFWIFGLIFILWIYYKIFKPQTPYQRLNITQISLILIFIFLLFNPTNIVIYLLIIILLANLFNKQDRSLNNKSNFRETGLKIFFTYITIISLFWAYNSYNFYISEIYYFEKNYTKAIEKYKYNPELFFIKWDFNNWLRISKRKTVEYFKYKIKWENNLEKKLILSDNFITKYNYAENYFYVWNIFWDLWKKEIAKKYYKKWLNKLPDLWNKNSKYYKEFLVKKLKIDDHRLTSNKYWLWIILERLK